MTDDFETEEATDHDVREDDILDDGPLPDPSEQEYYDRMADTLRPAGFLVEVRHGTEGPRHDPYRWTVYDVTLPDGTRAMYRDSEFTECLNITYPEGTHLRFSAPQYRGDPPMELMFKDLVGYGLDQLSWWANEDWERYADVRQAELMAGWDASP